jgi:hypothetical protein
VDSSSVRAAYGGEATGPSPVDRAKPGTEYHALTDGACTLQATSKTRVNR